jgi:Protein of unknown function (DUF1569)
MKSLFNAIDNNEIISRIQKLDKFAKAEWGKMNVGQMLAHCQVPIQVAFDEKKLKRGLIGILFGKMSKRQLTADDKPFKKHLPTDKHFIIKGDKNVEEEKQKLIALVKRFAEKGPEAISKQPHPFFGKMTVHDWNKIMYKHLDHHLRQFGV